MSPRRSRKTSTRILAVGLPESGKTSFIAALWEVVDSGSVEGSLRSPSYTADQAHLNRIRDTWAAAEAPGRTRQGREHSVDMLLADGDEPLIQLTVPDFSGESFVGYWVDRKWSVEHEKLVSSAVGVLLFVHPSHLNESPTILQTRAATLELPEDDELQTVGGEDLTTQVNAFDPEHSPTDTVLVDLLQMIVDHTTTPIPVAVIVSAWDLVDREGALPLEWLRTRLPLLSQFLSANEESFPFKVYGISAQGGDLASKADELLKLASPADRILVIGTERSKHDISAPIRWIVERA